MPGTGTFRDRGHGMGPETLIHQDVLARLYRTDVPPGVTVVGEVDLSNAAALSAAVKAASRGRRVTVDLSRCDHLGSAGIGAIVEAWQGEDGLEIDIIRPSPGIRHAIEVSGIERFPGIRVADAEVEAS